MPASHDTVSRPPGTGVKYAHYNETIYYEIYSGCGIANIDSFRTNREQYGHKNPGEKEMRPYTDGLDRARTCLSVRSFIHSTIFDR